MQSYLSPTSYRELRKLLSPRDGLICAIALYTGQTTTDVIRLKKIDIYTQGFEVRNWLAFDGGERLIPVHPALKAILESYKVPRHNSEWLFPSPRDSAVQMDISTFDKALRKAIALLDEPVKVSTHLFADTFRNALTFFPEGFEPVGQS